MGSMDAARRADDAVADRGDESTLPALFAIPVTIKENVDMAGQATTNGVPALADLVAEADAPLVRNLMKAGAIVVATGYRSGRPMARPAGASRGDPPLQAPAGRID